MSDLLGRAQQQLEECAIGQAAASISDYLNLREDGRGREHHATAMVLKIVAVQRKRCSTEKPRVDMDTKKEEEVISTVVKTSLHLVDFANACRGPGIFLLLNKGFCERFVRSATIYYTDTHHLSQDSRNPN